MGRKKKVRELCEMEVQHRFYFSGRIVILLKCVFPNFCIFKKIIRLSSALLFIPSFIRYCVWNSVIRTSG